MIRSALRSLRYLALIVPLAVPGLGFAGGELCRRMDAAKATAASCPLAKIIAKDVKLTEDGAVVTMAGKNAAAVSHIQTHLRAHADGGDCPNCPLTLGSIDVSVTITPEGGVITAKGNSRDSVGVVHDWADIPGPPCCARGAHPAKI